MLLFLFNYSMVDFYRFCDSNVFFTILNRYGFFTIEVFWRWFRSTIAGQRKIAIPWWDH